MGTVVRFCGAARLIVTWLAVWGLLLFCLDSAVRAQSTALDTTTYPGGGLFGENPFKAEPKTEADKKREDDCGASSPEDLYGRGVVLMFLNQLPQALHDFDLLLSKHPDRKSVYANRAYVRAALAPCGNVEELRGAEQDLEQAGPDESSSIARAARGILASKRGDCVAALADLSWAIEHGFDTWCCRGYRATVYSHLGDHARAIDDIEHAIKDQPSWVGPRRLLGNCHMAMGKPELAMVDYEEELRLDPENLELVLDRLTVASGLSKPEASLEDLDRLIARQPDHAWVLCTRGLLRWLAGKDLALVKADFERAAKLYPQEWLFQALSAALDFKRAAYAKALGDAGRCYLALRRTQFEYSWSIEDSRHGDGRFVMVLSWHFEGKEGAEEKKAKPADLDHKFAELGLKALWAVASR